MNTLLSAALLAGSLTAAPLHAAQFDFAGQFTHDNDVLRFDFNIAGPGRVSLLTSSWLGGGFDPILTLWDSAGRQLAEQDDGGVGGGRLAAIDYGEFDSLLTLDLAAGNYIATLSQYDNFSVDMQLANGFLRDNDPWFSAVFGCSNGRFCEGSLVDSAGNPVEPNRTADWSLHILGADSAAPYAVAEPATAWLAALAGLLLLVERRLSAKKCLHPTSVAPLIA